MNVNLTHTPRWALAAVSLSLAAAGCPATGWQAGSLGPEAVTSAPVPNALAAVLGEGSVDAAAIRLTADLVSGWPRGLNLDGKAELPSAAGEHQLSWQGLSFDWGAVDLEIGPAGLVLAVSTSVTSQNLRLDASDGSACTPKIAVERATLRVPLNLSATADGRVTASAVGLPELRIADGAVDWSPCDATPELDPAKATAQLLETVAADMVAELSEVLPGLPAHLEADWAQLTRWTSPADGVGQGSAVVEIRADGSQAAAWVLSGGRIYVTYDVGVDATAHACMPPGVGLPAMAAAPLPAVATEGLAAHADTLRRIALALWNGGAMCGDHALGGATLAASDLSGAWPTLDRLGSDTALAVRVWPQEGADLAFEPAKDGALSVLLTTGTLEVEIFGELDGARALLGVARVRGEARGTLRVTPDGTLWAEGHLAYATGAAGEPGLLGTPPAAVAEALAAELAVRMMDDLSWTLPDLPGQGAPSLRLVQGYIVIERPQGE